MTKKELENRNKELKQDILSICIALTERNLMAQKTKNGWEIVPFEPAFPFSKTKD